jgi:tRNA pseudouridine38-40 synthase
MAASFHPPLTPSIPIEMVHKALNKLLPKSIYIKKMDIVRKDFNARFDAVGKAYTYVICNSQTVSPFVQRWTWHVKDKIDESRLVESTLPLIGEHDFSSFAVEITKSGKNPIREISRIEVNRFGDLICITLIGKSFLYKMVRSIVGTIIMAGLGKIEPDDVAKILDYKNRLSAYDTAPPQGLFLMKVFYNEEDMLGFKQDKPPFF